MGRILIEVSVPDLTNEQLNHILMGKDLGTCSPIGELLTPHTTRYVLECRDMEDKLITAEEGLAI